MEQQTKDQAYIYLKKEYENYQYLAEQTIQDMSGQVVKLEKKIDNYSMLIEMIKYINVHIKDSNILYLLNDMLLGIIGSTYSTIYESNKHGEIKLRATNSSKRTDTMCEGHSIIKLKQFKSFILNNKDSVFINNYNDLPIHSILGMPIMLKNNFLGYILLEHDKVDSFNEEHLMFLSAIASQIAVFLENNRLYREVQDLANKDTLTSMFNRRYFFKTVNELINNNPQNTFGIIMIDIDNFKQVNDTCGHQFGDEILVKTSEVVGKHIGDNGICARYGGEEIIIFLKDVNDYGLSFEYIDELRERVQSNIVEFNGLSKSVTISIGMGIYRGIDDSLDCVIKTADELLYKAKENGRNRLMIQDNCM